MASETKLEEQTLQNNWQREVDSGYLYRKLYGRQPDGDSSPLQRAQRFRMTRRLLLGA